MIQNVEFRTYKKLNCSLCNALIVLQLRTGVSAGSPFLDSVIVSQQEMRDTLGVTYWYYTFSYDTTELASPSTALVQADILGVFCQSALTEYIRYLITQNAAIDAANTVAAAAATRAYFPSQRVGPTTEVGVLTGLAIPNTVTAIKALGSSFTNTDTKPVGVTVLIETPLLALTLASTNGYSFDYDLDITNDAVNVFSQPNTPLGGFRNEGPDNAYYAVAPGLSGVGTGAIKVLPGKILGVAVTLKINGGPGSVNNEILVNGPWINMNINPADV